MRIILPFFAYKIRSLWDNFKNHIGVLPPTSHSTKLALHNITANIHARACIVN